VLQIIYCFPDLTKLAKFVKAVKQFCPEWGAEIVFENSQGP